MRVLARFAIATCKTPDAGRCVACKRRCVIMEPQALAQSYRPQRSVILDRVPFGHLRLRYKGLVKAVKWVEYWIAVVVRCAVRPQAGSTVVRSGIGTNLSVRSCFAVATCGVARTG